MQLVDDVGVRVLVPALTQMGVVRRQIVMTMRQLLETLATSLARVDRRKHFGYRLPKFEWLFGLARTAKISAGRFASN